MVRVAILSIGILAAAAMASNVAAQPAQKPSRPLNLAEFAKTSQPRPKPAARPVPTAQPAAETPLITGSADRKELAAASAQGSDVARFCSNIADQALDARVAWQQKELEATEAKLKLRIAELEAKRAEYEEWLKLRDEFLKKAEENVVEIYSRMNPEAAAQQIASMADDTAAAVLAKLKVRVASAILNEMEPARGAHLADTLAGMRRTEDGKARK
jgi:flagellar motility protein MotE (MotC chaperone)